VIWSGIEVQIVTGKNMDLKGSETMPCKKPPTFKDRSIHNTCGTHLRAVLRTSCVCDSSKTTRGRIFPIGCTPLRRN
jgi:hypothetical protein